VEIEGVPGPQPGGEPFGADEAPPADSTSRRVLTILRYLAGHRPATTSAIVRDCHVPRSSAYRLLRILEDEEFVLFDADLRRWGLGRSAYELASRYALPDSLARQSESVVAKLAAQTGALMAAVAVLDGTDVMMLSASRPAGDGAVGDGGGGEAAVRFPAHLTATGKALLAHRSRGELIALYGKGPLARPTGRGPGTVDELLEALQEVEQRGFAESAGDLADGIWAFAAPVRCTADRVVGALGAAFRRRPPGEAALREAASALTSAAAEVSCRLGYRPGGTPTAPPRRASV
jgi:DNA-binding IclR family transcriptional regulator